MVGLKSLGRGEYGNVSGTVVDGFVSSATESVWGSDLIVGVTARWGGQFDSDLGSTDFDFLAIVLKIQTKKRITTHENERRKEGGRE
jgi:hypothetical protein